MTKKILRVLRRSKTMIFAQLLAVFGVLQSFQVEVSSLLADPAHRTAFIVGVAVIVALLRGVTKQPLNEKAEDK